ncbi:PREDICTED: transcription factor IIIA-like isoform X1 [Nicotiana attenuata]|uniref:transcription factor IIIA-like isoform X1 n=1 Tax=Nicotiana attenuata TaxID=49451 RepID=UPI0009050CCF|nr:PREDICTED: transcription factor IIIA-like isoform X1 [Nicotiana attenuata]
MAAKILGEMGEEKREVIFRDIRRYYCEFCGICRSKKSLISSHILSNHHDEMERRKDEANEDVKKKEGPKINICEECGVSFQKPAHLKQHMQSHSLEIERPFVCHIDDCQSSYRRKDHLTRHLLQHQGKLFECPVDGCKRAFSIQGNMTRHVKEMHDQRASPEANLPKQYVCSEPGCGKVFKFASKLKKHEDSHVKLEKMEALCLEPGCMKHFTNEKCLKEHIESCHQHIVCEICGTKQLKKNIKRHLQTHEEESTSERIKCEFQHCQHTFSTKSNLIQHVKAVHLGDKPFSCGIAGCGMKFAFKHVRDRHEKSGCHVYTPGDFVEADEQFRSRPRGGRKRKLPVFEAIMRKRITPPCGTDPVFYQGSEYLSWLLSAESDEEL